MASALIYRRLASPLHATRATLGAVWTITLIAIALCIDHPIVLGALIVAIVLAGAGAGVGRQLVRALRTALIVALPIVVVNVLVSRDGLTVFLRLGDLGPFGQGNLTVESLVYGATIALKVAIVVLSTTLASLAVDPDELLRVVRRLSFRSALTASLATRMIPVLAGDAQRLAEAQRTRPAGGLHVNARARTRARRHTDTHTHARARTSRQARMHASARVRLLSAIVGSSLDRAIDMAATLELRGFAGAHRAPRRLLPWSRHDFAFAVSATSLAALALATRLGSIAAFNAYPQVGGAGVLEALLLSLVIVVAVLLPFLDRRGIEP